MADEKEIVNFGIAYTTDKQNLRAVGDDLAKTVNDAVVKGALSGFKEIGKNKYLGVAQIANGMYQPFEFETWKSGKRAKKGSFRPINSAFTESQISKIWGAVDSFGEMRKINDETARLASTMKKLEHARKIIDVFGDIMPKEEFLKYRREELTAELNSFKFKKDVLSPEEVEKVKSLYEELQNVNDELKKMTEPKKKSSIEKLFDTFKRLGFYRIGRNFFRFFEKGLSEGIQNLAKFSPEVEKTMSQLVSDFTILANSASVILFPLIKLAEPILTGLTKVIANLASGFSYLAYTLGITSTWFKVNTEYMKDFNQESNKFSFDKFEALSGDDDTQSMFEKMTGADSGISSELNKVSDILVGIMGTLATIGSMKLIDWIFSGNAKKFFDGLITSLTKISDKFYTIAGYFIIFYDVYNIVKETIDLIKNWDSKSTAEKIKSILKIALYGLSAIAAVIGLIKKNYALVAAGVVAGLAVNLIESVPTYANGGIVDSGSLFIAGEAGAELVTTMPNGQTGVTNIQQFKQAQLEALSAWWASAKYDLPETAEFKIDGAEIARSKSFISEINRKNAGLNLR